MSFFFNLLHGKKVKILLVCTANVCRSPMAHAILRGMVRSRALSDKIFVESAGTHVPTKGLKPDVRSIALLKENGVAINNLRTRQFQAEDIDIFDYIFVMDNKNMDAVLAVLRNHNDNVRLLLEGNEVPDPYYAHSSEFRHVYKLIEKGCNEALNDIVLNKKLEVNIGT